jgi:hypothetical protein
VIAAPISSVRLTTGLGLDHETLFLSYAAACRALAIDPATSVLHELALLTRDGRDLMDAIDAMRTARPYWRIHDALTLLHGRNDERRRAGQPHESTPLLSAHQLAEAGT